MSGSVGSSIATALINAKNRGVQVRVICEYDNQNSGPFTSLASSGVPLINDRYDPINNGVGLMHNKFLSIDSRGGAADSAWVWTGSWNLTDSGTDDDYQNAIEIQDLALAKVYTIEFEEMWGSSTQSPNASASRFGARKLDNTPHRFVIGGKRIESYFSPSDNVTGQIIALSGAAQHSIGFEMLTLTRTDISAQLVARKNAGVKVRGDLDNSTDTGSQYAYLTGNGVDVRLKTGTTGLLHHKYAIFDADSPGYDGVTLTGSHNWSSAAENQNNENTLVLRDPDITNQYLQEFGARYLQFGGTDTVRVTAVEPIGGVPSRSVSLAQNYPNPFRGRTSITYSLPAKQKVVVKLYDVAGREVRTLVNQEQTAGNYRIDFATRSLESGVYFYRLTSGGVVHQRKMLLMR
jgi:phosphatidylserine/phosphatidylglycerophosphate/cardiolipin synthase-like enzyme